MPEVDACVSSGTVAAKWSQGLILVPALLAQAGFSSIADPVCRVAHLPV